MRLYHDFKINQMSFSQAYDLSFGHFNCIFKFVFCQLNFKFIFITVMWILVGKLMAVDLVLAWSELRNLLINHGAHEIIRPIKFVLSNGKLIRNYFSWINFCHKIVIPLEKILLGNFFRFLWSYIPLNALLFSG